MQELFSPLEQGSEVGSLLNSIALLIDNVHHLDNGCMFGIVPLVTGTELAQSALFAESQRRMELLDLPSIRPSKVLQLVDHSTRSRKLKLPDNWRCDAQWRTKLMLAGGHPRSLQHALADCVRVGFKLHCSYLWESFDSETLAPFLVDHSVSSEPKAKQASIGMCWRLNSSGILNC